MKRRIARTARAGFTLIEVLVTLVLIALLVGVVLPSVIGQLGAGEDTRVQQDLEAVRSAGKMFRIDVKRWPSSLEQLVLDPEDWANSDDINGVAIPAGLTARWNGPYLETGSITNDTDELVSGGGATIQPDILSRPFNGADFWTIVVENIDTLSMKAVGLEVDGFEDLDAGRIQMVGAGTVVADTVMRYYASPIN